MRIGIDIEEVKRFVLSRNHPFIRHAFTKKEMRYAFSRKNPAMHLCGFFCAKEALIKALCPASLLLREIEITHGRNDEPKMSILKKSLKIRKGIDVSISHTEKYAVAVVMGK